jgi:dolichol kinase
MEKQKVSIKQWHYFSGMLLAIYLFFHLANQLASLVSIEFHDNMMTILWKVYHNPFI